MKRQEILLMRLDRLGDLVLTLPAIYSAHKNFPKAKIDLLINEKLVELVEGIPFIRRVYTVDPFKTRILKLIRLIFDLRKNNYDLAIDLAPATNHLSSIILGLTSSQTKVGYAVGLRRYCVDIKVVPPLITKYERDMVLDILRRAGLKKIEKKMVIPLDANATRTIEGLLEKYNITKNDKLIGIFPGAGDPLKMWPKENFIELIKKIKKEYSHQVIVCGGKEDRTLCDEITQATVSINFAGRLNLKQLCAFIKRLDLFIGNNSGPMHIAIGVGTTVIVCDLATPQYNPTFRWIPQKKGVIVLNKSHITLGDVCKELEGIR